MRRWCLLLLGAIAIGSGLVSAQADDPSRKNDEVAIRKVASDYVIAIARRDAKAALAHWTEDGDIIDEEGQRSNARQRIELDAAALTGEIPSVVELPRSTIRFLGADTAIEDGIYSAQIGSIGRFSAIWSKTDGKWRLASLREARSMVEPIADLAELKWLVGHWIGERDGTTFEITARWNQAETYLERHLVATHNGTVLLDAEQRIGADPEDGQVKCWTHDVEGGHSEGIWSRQATSWIVESRGVTADGEDLRGTSVYTPQAENQIYWQSLNNWRGGRPLLDFDVTLSRSTEN